MTIDSSRRVPLGRRRGRAPDRGRQLEQRLVGVRARARTRRASRSRATAATASTATPTTSRWSRDLGFGVVPLLDRVVADRARRRRVLARRARLLPARCSPTCHEHGVAPVVTFHHFTTPRWMADARRLGRARDRRPVRAVLRAGGRAPRRPHRDGLHDQRAERRVAARLPRWSASRPGSRDFGAVRARRQREPARRAHRARTT